tara:strand:- start:2411 stop:2809 length:399 start_codon:yes stop_codon:yes gene_type:complete
MTWEDIVKKDPKQGPRRSAEMLEQLNYYELMDLETGLEEMANIFIKNGKYLKQLVGKKEAQEVVRGIGMALQVYASYLKNKDDLSTDNMSVEPYVEGYSMSAEQRRQGRESIEEQAKEYDDLLDDLAQSLGL